MENCVQFDGYCTTIKNLKYMKKLAISSFSIILILLLVAFQEKQEYPTTIFLIGDSTMENKSPERYPETGWGQVFGELFKENIKVENHAMGGRSSKSFISEGRWDKVYKLLKPGDYVFIQFGHNDQKINKPELYTNPYSGYQANLERYVNETRSKGAIPIILSSIVRRRFNEYGTLEDSHGAYPFVAGIVAHNMGVFFIDLQLLTENLLNELGPKDSEKLFLFLKPGESENYPEGISDNSHLSYYGAKRVASLVAHDLKRQNHVLAKYLNEK